MSPGDILTGLILVVVSFYSVIADWNPTYVVLGIGIGMIIWGAFAEE